MCWLIIYFSDKIFSTKCVLIKDETINIKQSAFGNASATIIIALDKPRQEGFGLSELTQDKNIILVITTNLSIWILGEVVFI